MPHIRKIEPAYAQHRRMVGRHSELQNRTSTNLRQQHNDIKKLTVQPGRHSGNTQKHRLAHAILPLFAILVSTRNCSAAPMAAQHASEEALSTASLNDVILKVRNITHNDAYLADLRSSSLPHVGVSAPIVARMSSPDSLQLLSTDPPRLRRTVTMTKEQVYEVDNKNLERRLFKDIWDVDISDVSIKDHSLSPFILFLERNATTGRGKRIAENLSHQIENDKYQKYVDNHCHIRTKTNQGKVVGNSFLVGSEYIRNPIRAAAERVYQSGTGGHEMPDWLVRFTEGVNIAYDVIVGFSTFGAYPIVKYASAKALATAGHATNNNMNCLKHAFSSEEMVNLLLDTEIGLTHRQFTHDLGVRPKPIELHNVRQFRPDGVFVSESMSSHLNTVKYMRVNHHGTNYLIREKQPGKYYTFHPHTAKAERLEKRVYFDAINNKIHFNDEMPVGHGLDYDIVDGKHFVKICGERHELNYNWNTKTPEVVLHKPHGQTSIPVYMEPLSKTWHLSVYNGMPVFSAKQKKIIDRIQVAKDDRFRYVAETNVNKRDYGSGKIYRAEHVNDDSHYTWGRYIEMNGKMVPVKMKFIPRHGIHYDVYDLSKLQERSFPIEWDGERWLFERPTSIHASSELKRFVSNHIYNKKIDASRLSAPDHWGLRYDKNGKKYLKINNHYYRIHKDGEDRHFILGYVHEIYLSYTKNQFFLNKNVINNRLIQEELKIKRIMEHYQKYLNRGEPFQCFKEVNLLNKTLRSSRPHPLVKETLEEALSYFIAGGNRQKILSSTKLKLQEEWLKNVILPLQNNQKIAAGKIIDLQMNLNLLLKKMQGNDNSAVLNKIFEAVDSLSTTPLSKYVGPSHTKHYGAPADASDMGITITGNARYVDEVQRALDEVRLTPSGKKILIALEEIGVEIRPPAMSEVKRQVNGELFASNSAGKTSIAFDPSNNIMNSGSPELLKKAPWSKRAPSIGLYHEMLHIYYTHYPQMFISMDGATKKVGGGSTLIEEARIVGTRYYEKQKSRLFDFSDDVYLTKNGADHFTENRFRKEYAKLNNEHYYLRPVYGDGTNQIPLNKYSFTGLKDERVN